MATRLRMCMAGGTENGLVPAGPGPCSAQHPCAKRTRQPAGPSGLLSRRGRSMNAERLAQSQPARHMVVLELSEHPLEQASRITGGCGQGVRGIRARLPAGVPPSGGPSNTPPSGHTERSPGSVGGPSRAQGRSGNSSQPLPSPPARGRTWPSFWNVPLRSAREPPLPPRLPGIPYPHAPWRGSRALTCQPHPPTVLTWSVTHTRGHPHPRRQAGFRT